MIGWAAATGGIDMSSIALFLIIFMLTPPHFWALALYREGDYARAGIPMLPVVAGADETRRQILLYSIILVPLTFLPPLLGSAGWLYAGVAVVLGTVFLAHAATVYRRRRGVVAKRAAKRLFVYSILYLFMIFALIIAERLLGVAPLSPVIG
jgi:protoheme IX farnesyltransferase